MYTISEIILEIHCTWTVIVFVMLLTFCNENKIFQESKKQKQTLLRKQWKIEKTKNKK